MEKEGSLANSSKKRKMNQSSSSSSSSSLILPDEVFFEELTSFVIGPAVSLLGFRNARWPDLADLFSKIAKGDVTVSDYCNLKAEDKRVFKRTVALLTGDVTSSFQPDPAFVPSVDVNEIHLWSYDEGFEMSVRLKSEGFSCLIEVPSSNGLITQISSALMSFTDQVLVKHSLTAPSWFKEALTPVKSILASLSEEGIGQIHPISISSDQLVFSSVYTSLNHYCKDESILSDVCLMRLLRTPLYWFWLSKKGSWADLLSGLMGLKKPDGSSLIFGDEEISGRLSVGDIWIKKDMDEAEDGEVRLHAESQTLSDNIEVIKHEWMISLEDDYDLESSWEEIHRQLRARPEIPSPVSDVNSVEWFASSMIRMGFSTDYTKCRGGGAFTHAGSASSNIFYKDILIGPFRVPMSCIAGWKMHLEEREIPHPDFVFLVGALNLLKMMEPLMDRIVVSLICMFDKMTNLSSDGLRSFLNLIPEHLTKGFRPIGMPEEAQSRVELWISEFLSKMK